MCGIAGIISLDSENVGEERLRLMANAIKHRGPEEEGVWINESVTAGFGHRRLSIIDLSNAAAQPMRYLDRYTITYNGEIYNYKELYNDLKQKGYVFSSVCDTEVVLAAYAHYGSDCVHYFDGMFAFAIWDDHEQKLFCARDRFGEKPFYFCITDEELLFASEMKALWVVDIPKVTDNYLLLQYLAIGTIHYAIDATSTFYKNISKLPASHYLECRVDKQQSKLVYNLQRYWDIDKETKIEITEAKAVEQLQQLLTGSVERRLRSDVPLGTSLSGGLDSSSIVATMQTLLGKRADQKTFSAIFPGFEKDEARQITRVVEQFGVESHTVTPTAEDLIKDFERLIHHQEEPFNSSSIYAQYKVYELARHNNITVLLDGQGADEVLAGYHKYYHWYWQQLIGSGKWQKAKAEIASAQQMVNAITWSMKNYFAAYLPSLTANRLEKKAASQMKRHPDIATDFIQAHFKPGNIYKPAVDKLNDILYFDTTQNGLEELLRYADRNSMAHSREVRLPFLNHELVQFIFSLPAEFKIREGWTKWILRKTMNNALPADIVWRKDKVGFEPPQKQWMQHKKMQEYIFEAKRKLVSERILKSSALEKPIQEHAAYESDNYDWRYLCSSKFI